MRSVDPLVELLLAEDRIYAEFAFMAERGVEWKDDARADAEYEIQERGLECMCSDPDCPCKGVKRAPR